MIARSGLIVAVKRDSAVCTVTIGGELDIATAPEAAALAAPATTLTAEVFVLDLAPLRFIDSRGARMLAELSAAVDPAVPVIVRSAPPQVHQVLRELKVNLERLRPAPGARGEWLLIESRAVRGWARNTRTSSARTRAASRDLAARSRQLVTRCRRRNELRPAATTDPDCPDQTAA